LTDKTSEYNTINTHPPASTPSREDLRLSVKNVTLTKTFNELALLSKRKARSILNVGNDTLKRIIDEGKIKIIIVNGKEKIPYVSLQEYVYSMSFKNEIDEVEDQFIDEENAVVIANKILEEINKGG